MIRMATFALGLLCCITGAAAADFTDVVVDPQFKGFLEAEPLLMEVPGARIFVLPEGKCVVLAVASVAVTSDSPQERLRNELICKNKAMAYFVGERDGVVVSHVETTVEDERIELSDNSETVKSISRFLGVTQSKINGIAKGTRVVGRWKTADKSIFYLAIGAIVDCDSDGSVSLRNP